MKNMKNDAWGWFGTLTSGALAAVQDNEIAQWITFGVAVVSGVLTILYTIAKWHEKAVADRKISVSEVASLISQMKDTVKDESEKIVATVPATVNQNGASENGNKQ
jgi:hypothetical protein